MEKLSSKAKALLNMGGNPYMVPTYMDNMQDILRRMYQGWDSYVNRNNPTYNSVWDTMMDEGDPYTYRLLRQAYGY